MLYAFYPVNCPRKECGVSVVYADSLYEAWQIMFEEFMEEGDILNKQWKTGWYTPETNKNFIRCDGH